MASYKFGDTVINTSTFQPRTGRMMTLDVGEYEEMRRTKDALVAELERISTGPKLIANVIEIRDDYVIVLGNGPISVGKPKHVQLKPGDTVRINPQTNQIIDVIATFDAGPITTVDEVVDDRNIAIMTSETGRRLVSKGEFTKLKQGDRIILDRGGLVVIRVLDPAIIAGKNVQTGISWDDIGGLEEAKRELIEAIEMPYKHPDLYKHYGQRAAKGVLLWGPPGTGKTMLGKACATSQAETHGKGKDYVSSGFIYVKGPELLNKFVGVSEENIRNVFQQARDHKRVHGYPAIIFIDESEALLGNRSAQQSFGQNYMGETIVPQFLSEMDGIEESGAFVLLATNLPNSLDPAVVRDSRIDSKIKVGRPDEKATRAIFMLHVKGKPCKDEGELADVAVEEIFSERKKLYSIETHAGEHVDVNFSHTVSGATVEGVVRRSVQIAIQRDRASGKRDGIKPLDVKAAVHAAFEQVKSVNLTAVVHEVVEPSTIKSARKMK